MRLATIEHFGHRPEQTQHEEDAHVGGKFGEIVEDGHKQKTTYSENKDNVALYFSELVSNMCCNRVVIIGCG